MSEEEMVEILPKVVEILPNVVTAVIDNLPTLINATIKCQNCEWYKDSRQHGECNQCRYYEGVHVKEGTMICELCGKFAKVGFLERR